MEEEFEEKKQRDYVNRRSIMDLGMGIIYSGMGVMMVFARKVGAKKTYLTHIAHDVAHIETNNALPPDVRLSYDGLEIPFDIPTRK